MIPLDEFRALLGDDAPESDAAVAETGVSLKVRGGKTRSTSHPPLSRSSKEEPVTTDIIPESALVPASSGPPASPPDLVVYHGDSYPACPCDNCQSNRAEALDLRARLVLLEDALSRDDHPALIRHHAGKLIEMLRERGVA